ncbi:hypothetical protein LPB140_01320 [Sphingorhabdus lutea]|uniref:Uncharacterized protein n=1 Tax=Sphingorhabdus lutea TaxID=1913578 RepID=A0A1L3J9A1_9SPHN|nr:hypothetical protein [Sphingorhabdus lutea]APG61698.1 hypothetical protein LPB140_01320 [Sphingorhabdus lutea]
MRYHHHKINILILSLAGMTLSACGGTNNAPKTAPAAARAPILMGGDVAITDKRGLESVLGRDKNSLVRMFGEPRLDVQEPYGRKLQFVGKACILDAYLYPEGKGNSEIVTHVDARRRDGAEVDRAACVNALSR